MEHPIWAEITEKFGQKWVNLKNEIFVRSRISNFCARRSVIVIIVCDLSGKTCCLSGKTEHGKQTEQRKKKNKNRAKLLLSVSSSWVLRGPGTSPYHLRPKHLRATWPRPRAIPPPSWGLLSRWHRQQTTTPEMNEASSARTQRHS